MKQWISWLSCGKKLAQMKLEEAFWSRGYKTTHWGPTKGAAKMWLKTGKPTGCTRGGVEWWVIALHLLSFQKVLMAGLSCKHLPLYFGQPQLVPGLEKGDLDTVRSVPIRGKAELHNVWKDEWRCSSLSGCLFGELENSSSCSYVSPECPLDGSLGREHNWY